MLILKNYECDLFDFEFWSDAKYTAEVLNSDDFEAIEDILSELYPDGMDETFINDLFRFEPDTIAKWLGYDDFEQLEIVRNIALDMDKYDITFADEDGDCVELLDDDDLKEYCDYKYDYDAFVLCVDGVALYGCGKLSRISDYISKNF